MQSQPAASATPQPKLKLKVYGDDEDELEETPEQMRLLGQGYEKQLESAKRIHKAKIDIAKTRAPVQLNSNKERGRVSPSSKPEFVRLAEKERELLKIHHEFSNDFDPRDRLTKKSGSNLHSISFKPPLSGASRPGVLH